jgi:hypothetical protein
MKFYTVDTETREVLQVTESQTVRAVSRSVGVAIGRWLISGLDCPDMYASDGVSEEEAARGIETSL